MFNLGFSEMILLGAIALIFIGPKQLPQMARTIARLLNELKRATGGIAKSVHESQKNIVDEISEISELRDVEDASVDDASVDDMPVDDVPVDDRSKENKQTKVSQENPNSE